MGVLRKRPRLALVLAIVAVVILVNFVVDVLAIQIGFTVLAFFAIIVIAATGSRRGSGGIQPQHYQGGNTGNDGGL